MEEQVILSETFRENDFDLCTPARGWIKSHDGWPWLEKRAFIEKDNEYRKNLKNCDTLNYYRDCPINGIVGFYSAILRSKDAERITNRVDTDQTAP